MRLLLVNPPHDLERYMGRISKLKITWAPVGALYLAAYAESLGHTVRVYDAQIEDEPLDGVLRAFQPELVGVSCVTSTVYSALDTLRRAKAALPRVPTVIGGVHPTAQPDNFMREPSIDYVAVGEGEHTLGELMDALEGRRALHDVAGLVWEQDEKIVHNPRRPLIQDLDSLPFPARRLVARDRYYVNPDRRASRRFDWMLSSRGCPYDCIFCANRIVAEGRYRGRSIDNVMAEMDELVARYGVGQIFFHDDNFNVEQTRTMALCEAMLSRPYKIKWCANLRVDNLSPELLALMRRAGCVEACFGIESAVQEVVDRLKKNQEVEEAERNIRLCAKLGITSRVNVILGSPGETPDQARETIRWVRRLPADLVKFGVMTPFPGTEMYDIAKATGRLREDDWTRYSQMIGYTDGEPPWIPDGWTAAELKSLQRKANLSHYLSLRPALRLARKIRSWTDVRELFEGLLTFLRASFAP